VASAFPIAVPTWVIALLTALALAIGIVFYARGKGGAP
jgi:hypothetical protein